MLELSRISCLFTVSFKYNCGNKWSKSIVSLPKKLFSCSTTAATLNMKGDSNQNFQFTQKTNPTTGNWEWVAETKDEHDYFTGE